MVEVTETNDGIRFEYGHTRLKLEYDDYLADYGWGCWQLTLFDGTNRPQVHEFSDTALLLATITLSKMNLLQCSTVSRDQETVQQLLEWLIQIESFVRQFDDE